VAGREEGDTMFGIGGWDWLTLGLYVAVTVTIGVWSARRIKDTADFFIGGRRFGKTLMVFFAFGAGTNGNQAIAVASGSYRAGMSGIWWQWLWLFATPFYWIIAPMFRRMRAVTTGDYFDMRYNGSVGALYSVVGIVQLSANMGVMLLGASKALKAISGGAIPAHVSIPLLTILFVFYGVAGGLSAAIFTDFLQGILTVLLSFMLLPFALEAVGGFAGLHDKIADPNMFRIQADEVLTPFFIAVLALNATVGIVCQPHIMGVCAAGRNEMDGRVGFAGGNLLKRVCTVAWMLTGLCAVVMYPGLADDKVDETYGMMARELLPKVLPGLVGVFLASMLASVMSSCDAFMVSCSGLWTQNIYRRYIAPDRDERHYIFVGRVASVVIVAMALVFAFTFKDVVAGLKVFWKISAIMAAAFWVGLFWRRATAAGAWAGALATFAMWLVTGLDAFNSFAADHLPAGMVHNGAFLESWQIVFYLSAGLVVTILVSLVTARTPAERLDRFYDCLRTPIGKDEPHLAPFTLPPGVTPGPPNKLVDLPDLEIPKPTLVGMAGFAFFWSMVAAMIAFVFWMATWGASG